LLPVWKVMPPDEDAGTLVQRLKRIVQKQIPPMVPSRLIARPRAGCPNSMAGILPASSRTSLPSETCCMLRRVIRRLGALNGKRQRPRAGCPRYY
jgi:hypothetical protein